MRALNGHHGMHRRAESQSRFPSLRAYFQNTTRGSEAIRPTHRVDTCGHCDRSARVPMRTRKQTKVGCCERTGGMPRNPRMLCLFARGCGLYSVRRQGCSWNHPSAVNFLAMTDPKHSYRGARIIDFVKDSVSSSANPPVSFCVFQLFASRWPRVFRKCQHLLLDLFIRRGRNGVVVLLGHRQNEYPVLHLRFRRFSAKACSRGIGVSPNAFASLQARISSRSSRSSRIFLYSSMLMTTATFSPRSFTTNWRSFPMGISLRAVYSRAKRRAIQTNLACSKALLVVGGGHFQHREEGFLRDVDLADALHAALAFFLFFKEFAFARNVAAVALGENVFANRRDGFARNHAAANRRLNRHFEHLPRNQFSQARHQFAPALGRKVSMDDQRQRIHWLAGDQHIQFDEVRLTVAREVIVERSVAA